VDAVGDATQAISLGSLAESDHLQFHAMTHGWQELWASVVHGEKRWCDVDRSAWRAWREDALALLESNRAAPPIRLP
jgi:hypothetical protein